MTDLNKTYIGKVSPWHIMQFAKTGDEESWWLEALWLWLHHAGQMVGLTASILAHGVREPIQIGNDARVWDGHHRIVAACLTFRSVPVVVWHK